MKPGAGGAEYDNQIDSLLERYLILLDEYTTLRARLATLQSGIYQDVARAHFGADRGLRYGQDFYQARENLVALRTVRTAILEDVPSFAVEEWTSPGKQEGGLKKQGVEEEDDNSHPTKDDNGPEDKKTAKREDTKPQNPLQWFGFMAPQALRSAQGHAIELVQGVIPRLASVNAEMLHVEIEIGRARKKRAKGAVAASKSNSSKTTAGQEGQTVSPQPRTIEI